MTVGLWATFAFNDVDQSVEWLKAIGFTEHAMYRNETEPTIVEHAEMLWPAGGGIMFGSVRHDTDWPKVAGVGATYLICDDVDKTHAAALAAGGTTMRDPREEGYGGRGAAVRDPEGNVWSFGTYRPA
jgi:uncharacterized glyoxalase superfamily protein PhnB